MELSELRNEIDRTDEALVKLFCRRMEIAAKIADYKKENQLPVAHPGREQEVLKKAAQMAGAELENYTRVLYTLLFELSRSYQNKCNDITTSLYRQISASVGNTSVQFPDNMVIACQNVTGTYTENICEKIFKSVSLLSFQKAEEIFKAVDQGVCRYGILPVNCSAGASSEKLSDLMVRYRFFIVCTCSISGNNTTDYICVSKNLEIYPGADQTGILMHLPHKPGALYKVLARFFALGINIKKLESFLGSGEDCEHFVYFNLEVSVDSAQFRQLICELDDLCEKYQYLGSYSEVVL